ncbi:AMP-binding protein [Methylocella sp. CPCC 101449]|uniref:AMP-binding protein n=1 Tax=Methylocella sp. CPCC 101449 TaxID=2987531 RepID=UPI0028900A6E|nr:AMP-binding protein [Methylocella sp. CPCC 101449]MDT2019547.1 AMP-binding protein [Methylocella sp. CPCC 101449]
MTSDYRTPRFADASDIAAFAATPLEARLAGADLLAMLKAQARLDGDAPAIRYLPRGIADEEGAVFSRRQLIDGVAVLAAQLVEQGLGPADTVAVLLPNGPGTLAASLAVMAVARLAPINLFLEPGQIEKLLHECEAKAVLVPKEAPPVLADVLNAVATKADGPKVIVVDTETLPAGSHDDPPSRDLSDVVALFHTGGTTGLPKFVPLTARHLAATATISRFGYGYAADDRVLCAMPMFHVGGLFACSFIPLISGSEVVVLGALGYRGKGVVDALPSTIEKLDLTVVVGPPTIMAQLAARPPDRQRARHLRLFVNGAAALPRVVGERLSSATGVRVVEPWGLTESTLAVTSGPRDGIHRQGSVGLPLPYCAVKAVRVDASGRRIGDCAIDEIGVLAIQGPMVFDGYLNRARDQQPFFDDGWLDTGDLGRVDDDGFVWVTGRAKELIKRGGHGIDPSMIEDALNAHPGVALAAAIGKPDAYAGELPMAYIQLQPGIEVTAEALLDFVRTRIPERAAIPKEIIVLEKLPVTAIGKVHKQMLKLDITQRVAQAVIAEIVAPSDARIVVQPHALHGLEVHAEVPATAVVVVRERLSAFAFRSNVTSITQR